jgi:hypothetical protein
MGGSKSHTDSMTVTNSNFSTLTNCMAVWAENPYKYIKLVNDTFKAKRSHHLYFGSPISVSIERCYFDTNTTGFNSETALAYKHYSDNEIPGKYSSVNYWMKPTFGPKSGEAQLAGKNYIDSAINMRVYNADRPVDTSIFVYAKNSNIGGTFRGTLQNCWGNTVNFLDSIYAVGINYKDISFAPGVFLLKGATVENIFGYKNGSLKPFTLNLIDCNIKYWDLFPPGCTILWHSSAGVAVPKKKWGGIGNPPTIIVY